MIHLHQLNYPQPDSEAHSLSDRSVWTVWVMLKSQPQPKNNHDWEFELVLMSSSWWVMDYSVMETFVEKFNFSQCPIPVTVMFPIWCLCTVNILWISVEWEDMECFSVLLKLIKNSQIIESTCCVFLLILLKPSSTHSLKLDLNIWWRWHNMLYEVFVNKYIYSSCFVKK